jgi:predicted nucleic acid-binding protein
VEYPTHEIAHKRIRELAEGGAAWAIPWPCVHEFLAIVTNARIFKKPSTSNEALNAMDVLMESPALRLFSESPGYWPILKRTLTGGRVSGGRIHDARIAAICLEHGVDELWTADRDFTCFPALKTRNPLAE